QGGTIGALVGPDGVFLVDAQFAPLTDKIVAAIKQISDGRIRFLVNTHVHGDHTGGNENLGKLGVVILARPELRARLVKPSPGANGAVPPSAPAAALPVVTYHGPVTDRAGMRAHRTMIIAIRDKVARLVQQGKTQEEVLASKPTSDYDGKVRMPGSTGDRFLGQLYAELKK